MILPGSCTVSGLRQRSNAIDSEPPSPVTFTVRVNNTPPACPTARHRPESTPTCGCNLPVRFTLQVLFHPGSIRPKQSHYLKPPERTHARQAALITPPS